MAKGPHPLKIPVAGLGVRMEFGIRMYLHASLSSILLENSLVYLILQQN